MADNTPQPEQLLREYQIKYPEENASIRATTHFLNVTGQDNPTNNTLVATAWIFNPHTGKVLLRKNTEQTYSLVNEPLENHGQSTQQAALTAITKSSGLSHLQLYANELFHLQISLTRSTAKEQFYQYNFCFLMYTHETAEQKVSDHTTIWVPPSHITTDQAYRSVYTAAKKWQLFCYEKETIA